MQELNDTAHKILDVAEHYTQTRGFNAFSYKDIQREVGVKTSSIHYYFPTKQDLAMRMTERYVERFEHELGEIARQQSKGIKRLRALGDFYVKVVSDGKFCMCGMLASDMFALPDSVNTLLRHFFQQAETWVSEAIQLGQSQSKFSAKLDVQRNSALFLSALEGGMLIARVKQNPGYLDGVIREAIHHLKQ